MLPDKIKDLRVGWNPYCRWPEWVTAWKGGYNWITFELIVIEWEYTFFVPGKSFELRLGLLGLGVFVDIYGEEDRKAFGEAMKEEIDQSTLDYPFEDEHGKYDFTDE